MKCKICGNTIFLQDSLYECSSCHNKFSIESTYENTEVFIAYVENDELGRRTKDSIVAQEIYNKLSNANINVFYQRISADGASGQILESIADFAISTSKVVVLIGTNNDALNLLLEKYGNILKTKKLLPVYADIEAYNLPDVLKSLQALNYNNVGAVNDLTKIVLHSLNRDSEYDIVDLNAETKKRRTVKVIATLSAIMLLIISGVSYYVFGTANVLPSKKYAAAANELSKENYVKAIELFSEITEYKDSSDKLKQIYNCYNGYYYDEKNNITLHISITDNIKSMIEIRKLTENGDVIIKESSEVNLNTISFGFNDSENNQGNVLLTLLDSRIDLNISTESKIETVSSFGEVLTSFNISEKSDKPLTKELDSATLKKWISKKHTISDIKGEGYDLTYITGDTYTKWSSYNISNTDIIIDFVQGNFSNFSSSSNGQSEEIAYVFTVPAKLIIPDKIGDACKPFIYNNILCFPDGEMTFYSQLGITLGGSSEGVINNETLITCVPKALISNEDWDSFVEDYIYSYYLNKEYSKMYGGTGEEYFTFIAENNEYVLATTSHNFNIPQTPIYKIHKKNYTVEFLGEFPYSTIDYKKAIYVEDFPEYFSDFIN